MRYDPRARRVVTPGVKDRPQPRGPYAPVAPTAPGGSAPETGVPVALPLFNFPSRGAFDVNEIRDADIAPAASSDVITFDVGSSQQLRISAIGFGADDEVALRFLTWSLFAPAGNPVAGYANVPSTTGTLAEPGEVHIHVPGPAQVVMRLTADTGAGLTYRYIARMVGWLYTDEVGR